ncbi:unnamed protein product, partial [Dicrocoelium dendriticum]
MLVADLTRIYVKPPADVRKIILASDIAESTLSFDDIAYVVDCGLNSFRTHVNWSEESVLRTQWISKVSAIQRQSRSTCICFRLYSKIRFDSLHCTRFIQLKGCQLEEACIQAYLLASPGSKIPVLLTYVPRPPKPEHYEAAIRSLIAMDALDQSQELTEIGYHICDLPIPPRYAKMVLVGVSLKCLDPILTIACILAYAEP